jgi:hypothetical protein
MNRSSNPTDEFLPRCLEGTAAGAQYEQAKQWVRRLPQNRMHHRTMHDAWIVAEDVNSFFSNL